MRAEYTILIIDDSEDDRDLYVRLLKKAEGESYRVLEAQGGEEGLAMGLLHEPDCILLDYSLPGRDGASILRDITSQLPHANVIMLTGQGNEQVAVDVMKAGAQDYLTKDSITAESLQRCIYNAISHSEMAKRLEKKRESLEIFTRAMAHDLKEPLRAIQSFSEIVYSSALLSDKDKEMMGHVLKASAHMDCLIQNVSRYTKLEACYELNKNRVSLNEVLHQVRLNLHQQIDSSRAVLHVSDLPNIYGDATTLTQLFQNLISNAIHYCPERRPEISVSSLISDGKTVVMVTDNGPGIDAKYHKEIFKPFKRLVDRSVEGSGLGLAICKKIVELHSGTIRCESVPGNGAIKRARFEQTRATGAYSKF